MNYFGKRTEINKQTEGKKEMLALADLHLNE
jgi:hypothetical protein